MDKRKIIEVASDLIENGDPDVAYRKGVTELAALLMFPDVPEAVAIELAETALKSEHW